MDVKRATTIGLMTAAAGAGAYFLFSRRFAPARTRIAEKVKSGMQEASRIAGQTRKSVKHALVDVSEITDKAAASL